MNIRTYEQLIQVLESMSANLPTYAAALGTTAADQAFLNASLGNANYIQDYCDEADTFKKAYFAIKQRFYNGEKGDIPDGPTVSGYAPAVSPLQGDTHGNLMKLIGRIKDANNYTHEIGVALGIAGDAPPPPNFAELQPTLEAFPGQSDYLYTVVVGNRGSIDMWELETQPVGSASWTSAGRFDGKSQDITYSPGPGITGPVQINLRIRLWKSGSFIGLYSLTVTITVNP